jgi:predicted methyltransferase
MIHRLVLAGALIALAASTYALDPTTPAVGRTDLLANPPDPRTAPMFDPAVRGKIDRFAYRFIKPRT